MPSNKYVSNNNYRGANMRKYGVIVIIIISLNVFVPSLFGFISSDDISANSVIEGPLTARSARDIYNDSLERMNPYPTSSTLMDVSWQPGGDYGLIVGKTGTVIKYDGSVFTDLTEQTGTIRGERHQQRHRCDLRGRYRGTGYKTPRRPEHHAEGVKAFDSFRANKNPGSGRLGEQRRQR